jgi:hypothetical protein
MCVGVDTHTKKVRTVFAHGEVVVDPKGPKGTLFGYSLFCVLTQVMVTEAYIANKTQ